MKNGTKMYFGTTNDSRIEAIEAVGKNGQALVWALNKVEDVLGNYYIIQYNEDTVNGDYYPMRIIYTLNDSYPLNKYRTVEFSYEERTDHGKKYIPTLMDMDKRLKWITVKIGTYIDGVGGDLLRKYELTYEESSSTGRSRLVKLQEYGDDGNVPPCFEVGTYEPGIWERRLPAQEYEWQEGEEDFTSYDSPDYYDNVTTGVGSYFNSYFSDVNGDRKTDWILTHKTGGSVVVMLGKSDGSFTSYDSPDYYDNVTTSVGSYFNSYFGDVNGDGKTDWILTHKTGGSVVVMLSTGPNPDLLTTIHNGLGGTIDITYEPAPQVEGAIDSTDKTYPEIANKSPRQLVRKITYNDGMETSNSISSTSYDYSNGMFCTGFSEDRTDLGFEWIKKINDDTESYEQTYYIQEKPLQGLMQRQVTCDKDGNKYREIVYEHSTRVDNVNFPKIIFIYKTNKYEYIYNGDNDGTPVVFRTQYVDADYDEYGNPERVIQYGEVDPDNVEIDIGYDKVEIYTPFVKNLTTYMMKPQKKETYAYNKDDVFALSSCEWYYYDNQAAGIINQGLLTKNEYAVKETAPGQFEKTSEEFTYDDYGNVVNTKDGRFSGGEFSGWTTGTSYDTDYVTFIKEKENALNHTTTTCYDDLMRPNEEIDANGVSVFTEFDEFGRVIATRAPGDETGTPTTRQVYHDDIFPMCIEKNIKDGPSSFNYCDGRGRTLQQKAESAEGWVIIDYYYDKSGRKWKTSIPYINIANDISDYTYPDTEQPCETTEYDDFDRVIRTYNTDETCSQVIYDKKYTYYIDAEGHGSSEQAQDNTIIQYTYTGVFNGEWDYNNNPDQFLSYFIEYNRVETESKSGRIIIRTIDDYATPVEITTHLDMLGRKTSYNDPDMGEWTYLYDANSNVIAHTDAKNQTIIMKYDELNRLVRKVYPDASEVNYYYDEASHGYAIGRLTRVVFPDGQESYTYDARGRITEATVTIDGISRTNSFTYDSMDRVVSETYPDGEVVKYTYESGGNVDTVSGTNTYVTGIDYSPLGKVTRINYGNGLEAFYDYYDTATEVDYTSGTYFSQHLKRIQVSNNTFDIFDLSYEYDKAGNVNQKDITIRSTIDDERSSIEVFTYDDLYRLETAGSDFFGFKSYQYNKLNNITQKDGRNYSYGSSKPHAVTNDGIYTYTYDANGNMLTRKGSDNRSFAWDYENRLLSVNDSSSSMAFAYNAEGMRIKKQEGDIITYYFFDSYEEVYEDQEGIGYFAIDPGVHIIDNKLVEAGITANNVNHNWTYVSFAGSFSNPPVLIANINTENGGENCHVDIKDCSATGFSVRIEDDMTAVTSPRATKYYFANNQRIAQCETIVNDPYADNEISYYHQDHLGSSIAITLPDQTVSLITHYDPYGAMLYIEGNGEVRYKFTGKELDSSGLYYFAARYYDPQLGRFISADPMMDGLNRYTYCQNNPLIYVDPSGNFIFGFFFPGIGHVIDAVLWLFCTDIGYELQQYISPIAIKIDIHLGTEQTGIGVDVSIGAPKLLPASIRKHYGATYYWDHYDDSYSGWETREGTDWTFYWIISTSYTKFDSGETSQTTFQIEFGLPGINVKVENDFDLFEEATGIKLSGMSNENGDRYRTAAVKATFGMLSIGLNLFTGDPGDMKDTKWEKGPGGHNTYITNRKGDNPDKYRAGVLNFGFGPLRVGINCEGIRHHFQNELIHRGMDPREGSGHLPYFRVLDIAPKFFFYFGTGTGGTLW